MSKNYLKREISVCTSGEVSLNRLFLVLCLALLCIPTFSLAELPDSSELDDLTLDLGIHFVRPESKYVVPTNSKPNYLSVDAVNFIACLEEDATARGFVVCLDNNNFKEIEMYPWSSQEYCHVGGTSLSDFTCQNAIVEVEYTSGDENLKISEEFIINTFSSVADKLVNSQYNDGGWRSALDTSFAILALSHFKEIFDFEITQAIEWMKLNRNNDLKCWPESPCNLKETTRIMALLAASGINHSFRVINDGKNYLEERQNYYEQGDDWELVINDIDVGTTLALVAVGQSIIDENFSIPANDTKRYNFTAYQDDNLTVIADANADILIRNQRNESRYTFQGDNLTFTIPGPCWSLNLPGEPCDSGSTIFAASANISDHRREEAKTYLKTQIYDGIVKHYYGDPDDPVESALYVKLFYDEEELDDDDAASDDQEGTYLYDVLQWVLFRQNNEGYWGEEFDGDIDDDDYEIDLAQARTEQLKQTAYVSMALLTSGYNRSSQPLSDAQNWVSSIEDEINTSDGGALGAALFIVQNNAYPLIYTDPSIIVVDAQVKEIDFINPTPFNYRDLTFTLSDSISDAVSVEEKTSLGAYKFRKVRFTKKSSTTAVGFVSVGNAGQEIARIPIVVQDAPTLQVSVANKLSIFGKEGSLQVTATKSNHVFDCSVSWDDSSLSTPNFRISKSSVNMKMVFSEKITKEDIYTGSMICKNSGQSFDFPLSIQVARYVDKPLTVFPKTLTVNQSGRSPEIRVQNNLDIDVIVSVSLDQYREEMLFPQDLFLEPGTSQNFTLNSQFDPLFNYTGTARLTFSTLDTSDTVTVFIDVISDQGSNANLLRLVIVLTFLLIVLGTLGYMGYKYRDDLLKYINQIPLFQSKVEIAKKKESLVGLRSEEKNKAIMNMYSILKFQQANDAEIKKRLLSTFTKDELRTALDEEGIILEGLEETEPEKV